MSCHYSCSTCSGPTYYDLCTSCPSTRTLSGSLCICQTDYYQVQQTQCQIDTDTSTFDSILITAQTLSFFIAIAFHIMIIILTLNRIVSPKIKKTIDTLQVIGLIAYYRFLQDELSSRALDIINVFNFGYFSTIVCSDWSPQLGCGTFQNLVGPAFTLFLFVILYFISYGIATCIYYANSDDENVVYIRNGREEKSGKTSNLSMYAYWKTTRSSLLLLYLDQTMIQTSLSLSRIAIVNYVGVFVILPFLVLVVIGSRIHFKTINDPGQTTLLYRAKNSYFYLYDSYYHLNYIDHLFEEENVGKDRNSLKQPFYPESNLMIMELLFKMFLATSSIVFYEYEPYLFAYFCIFLLVIFLYSMDHIFFYEKSTLFFYLLCLVAHGYAVGTFFLPQLFTYYIVFLSITGILVLIVSLVGVLLDWKGSREGEMINKMYEIEDEESKIADDNLNQSEEQLKISNKREELKVENIENQRQANDSPVPEPITSAAPLNPDNMTNRLTHNRTFATRKTNPLNPNITNLSLNKGLNQPNIAETSPTPNLLNQTKMQTKYVKQGTTQNNINANTTHNNVPGAGMTQKNENGEVADNNVLGKNVTQGSIGPGNGTNKESDGKGPTNNITEGRFSKAKFKKEVTGQNKDQIESNAAEKKEKQAQLAEAQGNSNKEQLISQIKPQGSKRSFKTTNRMPLKVEEPTDKKGSVLEEKESARSNKLRPEFEGSKRATSKKNIFQAVEEEEEHMSERSGK